MLTIQQLVRPTGHRFTLRYPPGDQADPAAAVELLLDDQSLRLVQRIRLEVDAESQLPMLTLSLVPASIQIEAPVQVQDAAGQPLGVEEINQLVQDYWERFGNPPHADS